MSPTNPSRAPQPRALRLFPPSPPVATPRPPPRCDPTAFTAAAADSGAPQLLPLPPSLLPRWDFSSLPPAAEAEEEEEKVVAIKLVCWSRVEIETVVAAPGPGGVSALEL